MTMKTILETNSRNIKYTLLVIGFFISIITLLIRAELLANIDIYIFELVIFSIILLFLINVIIVPIGVYIAVEHNRGTTQDIISNSMIISGFFIIVSFIVFFVCASICIVLQTSLFSNSMWILYLVLFFSIGIGVMYLIIKGDKILDFFSKKK
ncbi:MAG: hypothetical protein H7647_02960 [Candidatus Heimdallarchaeota archaeon]|nr:hypothetical protein [Candidatus Heimdallarchaeota archaeon]MCK4253389.1 hypothetical protein [Candidatus Heimdallarchaeota archaeon]